MHCPKCVGILEKKRIEEVEVDVCPICEGIWFDAGELKAVLAADSHDFDYIDVGREEFDGHELAAAEISLDRKPGKCPRCADGTMLVQTRYEQNDKVIVDVCPLGHGLWLDGGEIQQVRKRGLVKLRDIVGRELDFLKYAFSKNGFRDLKNKFRRKK